MTQEPRQEVEVQGGVGEPVALPLENEAGAAYGWNLELPDGVDQVEASSGARLAVSAAEPGSYVLVATLAEATSGVAMTVLPIRLTVA